MNSIFRHKHSYSFAWMLISFSTILIVGPYFTGFYSSLFFSILFGILLISSVFSLSENKLTLLIGSILGIVAIGGNIYAAYTESFLPHIIGFSSSALLILVTIIVHLKSVFFPKEYTPNLIFGAISVYILVGVFFALFYALIEYVQPNTFQGLYLLVASSPVTTDQGKEFQHFIYYSFVTQTTLGYGDITPLTTFSQNVTIFQAVCGQFYMATLVAGLVGKLLRNSSF